ncbi:MAG TPA: nucleotidyltransferase domain-containing protein [Gammaproteobacteria bacterium]|nr:nucleotidyltransferase domain-containing protein [Gammaproteobacteria bacterium]
MSSHPDEGPMRQVADLLSADEDIVLAIVFGSAVSGKLRPDSDVDIAILTRAPLVATRRRELNALLARATGRPVDLVDLRTAGVVVTRAALRQGTRVVCRDRRALADLLSKTLLDAADFLPYRERILSERRQAWIH